MTVLFADLTDSTALTQRLDPERVRDILGAFYRAVSEELWALRGRAEKFIGDAVMAVFGLQQTNEDDALRAVRAGLGIRARARRLSESLGLGESALEVRVGIATGDVAAGLEASGQSLVTGPAVNMAARLQVAAEPGEILVGGVTHALTTESVLFGDGRDVKAKGFDDPLRAHPVEGLTTRSIRRTIPLVGRHAELALMRDAFECAISTGQPQLLSLLGEAGIGKTRLIDELAAGLETPSRTLVGQVQPPDWGPTFSAVSEMLQQLVCDFCDPATIDTIAGIEDLLDGNDHESGRILRQVSLLLGPPAKEREQSTFVSEVQEGFIGLIGQLARRAPMIVAFDGLERASPPLLDLVERLAARGSDRPAPVLVIAAARGQIRHSDGRSDWGGRARSHTMVRLTLLDEAASTELVRGAGAGRISPGLASEVARRAGGNPFFIVEMTGQLLNDGPAAGDPGPEAIPPTVHAVVASRLDLLPTDLRTLVRRASVLVFSFDLQDLALVAEAGEAQLAALEEAEVLVREERRRATWRFRHETLREVAYATLSKRERLRLHLQIADGLISQGKRPAWVPDHLERAAQDSLDLDPTDRSVADRALRALAEAGDRARGRMESRAAISRYNRALALMDELSSSGAPQASILAGLGESHYWLGEYQAAAAALRKAEALSIQAGDDRTLAAALRFLGDIALNTRGGLPEAGEIFTRALEAAERSGDATALCRTLLLAGWEPWTRDDLEEANRIWARSLELARKTNDRWAEVRALCSLSASADQANDPDGCRAFANAAVELATDLGDRFSLAVATVQLGRALMETGNLEESITAFNRALPMFDDLGARWEYADLLRTRGGALRDLGLLSEAEDDLKAAIRILDSLGELSLAHWTWMALARVADRRGDRAQAEHWRQHAGVPPDSVD